MSNKVLANFNSTSLDSNIVFYEKGHKYEVLDDRNEKYTSVTTYVHNHFPKFNADLIIESMMNSKGWGPDHKYWGQSPEEIKKGWNKNSSKVAVAGTNLHYQIECFMNNEVLDKGYTHKELLEKYNNDDKNINDKDIEWVYFTNFVRDLLNLKPYRTEWMIYDKELKISGSIDMVYENEDGTLSIYDWKRCKEINKTNNWNKFALTECISHLPDTNFWHYTLQLNLYKIILERKYNRKVKELYLVKIHPDNTENNYELLEVPILQKEMSDLIEVRKKDLKNR